MPEPLQEESNSASPGQSAELECCSPLHQNQDLIEKFTHRIVNDLVDNNVLRGAWVEEVVAHFLPGWTFPGQWSYFDLLHPAGEYTLSVKHATGVHGRFGVARRRWAWDNRLAGQNGHEGWRGGDDRPPQYWCDVYVFAWLDGPVVRERVLSPDAWRFAILSRGAMYRHLGEASQTVSVGWVRAISGGGIPGFDLERAVNAALAEAPPPDVPLLNSKPYEAAVKASALNTEQQILELPD